ncbi:ATP-binding cassette domain-containing protein [Diaphorobacter sp. JS3050]|uniref:ABC transporter ATP-binding protein n=1 Tax=Diaphorobacter sp. JS3050 TaxID=2735554 RepID=UPI00155375D5|nr:ATP-binding cassette domain-containing protein [Diaphorobacter sp. JS3050]QJY32553.1 ATP-binding cassette domain-containing protein [Diaphorobacter sp. JS3050]
MLKGPEPIASPPALRADGICFGFAQRPLFQHWSADFPAGLVLVQGGDGAGKTSLLRLMAGEWTPQAGRMLLHGTSATQHPAQYRAQVFWRDPRAPWPQAMTAQDWAAGQRTLHARWSEEDWRAHAAGWGIAGHLHKAMHQLSAGSQRKVLMAGLDKASIAYLLQALQREASAPRTSGRVLVVAHYDALGDLPWRHRVVLPE